MCVSLEGSCGIIKNCVWSLMALMFDDECLKDLEWTSRARGCRSMSRVTVGPHQQRWGQGQ